MEKMVIGCLCAVQHTDLNDGKIKIDFVNKKTKRITWNCFDETN